MTALLATERIKLFTTRSPWWSMIMTLGITVGLAGMVALTHAGDRPLTVEHSQFGSQFGLMIITVMAALAVTTEYRFATIRTTFQAVPNRTSILLAKTAVVTGLAVVVGEITAFGSWAVAKLIDGGPELSIRDSGDLRMVAGVGLVYGVAAVMAVAVGILVRQSAGAISILLIWPLLAENLVGLIPRVGDDLRNWMPYVNAGRFLNGVDPEMPLSAWGALAYFAGVAAVLLGTALVVANRRDA
ncbi:ABC transporter permease [Actinokineospora sp. NBRC 105648]|uniref:ABC transporter permease n=1 Tax=Actinokineospora sp. NBRC 105648 TaxID=3032206 RepID=UPI00249FE7C6|nr:ABC transporter permease [Actinokineospora sp. NBRC 105648]GLZ37458.1 ABC transporter permease [Actinokineospora sp. NBRC 105648]